jgi:hypothetical protein
MVIVHLLKAYRGVEVRRLSFFTSALDVVDQREASAGIYSVGGWVGPKPGLDSSEKGEMLPLPGIEPLIVKPQSSYCTGYAIPVDVTRLV